MDADLQGLLLRLNTIMMMKLKKYIEVYKRLRHPAYRRHGGRWVIRTVHGNFIHNHGAGEYVRLARLIEEKGEDWS